MRTDLLLEEIKRVFPPVAKPAGLDLSFHKAGCDHCVYLRDDLNEYPGEELPPEALRLLHSEMSCLSAKGWRWVLPSYLRYCVEVNDTYDGIETEFLIYNLAPDLKYQQETLQRMSALDSDQIQCLIYFIDWCANHEHWSDYCRREIYAAQNFLQCVKNNRK